MERRLAALLFATSSASASPFSGVSTRAAPVFVRAPEGNGCAERFIRTLKENLLWVRTFHTVEELRVALLEFKRTYNEHWLIERHGHRSPAQFGRDQMDNQAMVA